MAQPRKILIADPDLEAARTLTRALRQRGYQVHHAPDGSRALEVAVLRHPDLALVDEACPLLDARTFLQILRTNPRTEDIPVVLTTHQAVDSDRLRTFRDGILRKPFNLDEVLARIDHVFRRADAARNLQAQAGEITGSLGQLALSDLLQILGHNRRSGRLLLARGTERGELHVGEGRPLNARLGPAEGDKALFRLLTWSEGTFSFVPGPPTGRVRIQRSLDDALLEGMRQADEVARLWPSLPPRTARLQLSPDAQLPVEPHPVTFEVMELLKLPRPLSEILDLCVATDLEVLGVLSTLLQKGVARIAEAEEGAEGSAPLLGAAELHALRSRLTRGRSTQRTVVAKVFVCGGGPGPIRSLIRGLADFVPLSAEPPALRSGFGTLGRLELSEGLRVELCMLPAAEAARPLWQPFGARAAGALVLDGAEQTLRLAHHLAFELRVPLVVMGEEFPASLRQAPAGALRVVAEPRAALRALLVLALTHVPSPVAA